MRLVWLLELLQEGGGTQVVHTYGDNWNLTGLSVREDLGLKMAVVFENPVTDTDLTKDNNTWQIIGGLQSNFISGRTVKNTDGSLARSLSLDEFVSRFQATSDQGSPLTWSIPPRDVGVEYFTLVSQDDLAQFPAGENEEILEQYFSNNTDATPTLIYAREETYRSAVMNSGNNVATYADSTLTIDMSGLPPGPVCRPAHPPPQRPIHSRATPGRQPRRCGSSVCRGQNCGVLLPGYGARA